MQFVVGSSGRSMQKEIVVIVEYVFAMIARIEHCRHSAVFLQSSYHTTQHIVGIAYGVVVCIDEMGAIFFFCFTASVGLKVSHIARVTLFVVEMRAVSVEHYEFFLAFLS